MYIGKQKLPIQRVRDSRSGREVERNSYKMLQESRGVDEALLRKILLGFSCRRYSECSESIPDVFSLTPSTVSRRFIKAGTENASVCKDFLNGLLERGFTVDEGVLCVMDGSRGIRKQLEEVFGGYAITQRCQWHKRENVVSYLPKGRQAAFRKLLQRAYDEFTYEGVQRSLERTKKELSLVNESAVRSLEEGLEATILNA